MDMEDSGDMDKVREDRRGQAPHASPCCELQMALATQFAMAVPQVLLTRLLRPGSTMIEPGTCMVLLAFSKDVSISSTALACLAPSASSLACPISLYMLAAPKTPKAVEEIETSLEKAKGFMHVP